MKLINGRGQLGEALSRIPCDKDFTIYHTWNLVDKSNEAQEIEFTKFKGYLLLHPEESVVFISTYDKIFDWYLFYKMKAEIHIIENTITGRVIKVPTLIGNGLIQEVSNGVKELKPGLMRVSTPDAVADKIVESLDGTNRVVHIFGELIDVSILTALLRFEK